MSTQRTGQYAGIPLVVVAVVAGVAWWIIGYLPWIMTGFDGSKELYSLDADYHTALPLHGYGTRLMYEYGIVGGLCASLAGFLCGGRRLGTWVASLVGMASAIVITLLQSYVAVQVTDSPLSGTDPLILVVLAFACVSGSLSGWALGLVATLGRVWLGLVIGVLCGVTFGWTFDLGTQCANTLHRITGGTFDLRSLADEALRWPWVVLLAISLIVIGARPQNRLAFWPAAVLITWFAAAPGIALAMTAMAIVYDDGSINVVEGTWDVVMQFPTKEAAIMYAVAIGVAGIATIGTGVWRSRRAVDQPQTQPIRRRPPPDRTDDENGTRAHT